MQNTGGVNKVFLLGRIGKDAECRYITEGDKCYFFQLATNESVRKNGVFTEITEWHDIKVPGNVLNIEGLSLLKGQMIYLEGRIQTTAYTDERGIRRYKTEIYASKCNLVS